MRQGTHSILLHSDKKFKNGEKEQTMRICQWTQERTLIPPHGGPYPQFPMAIAPNYGYYNHFAHGGIGTMYPLTSLYGDPQNMMPRVPDVFQAHPPMGYFWMATTMGNRTLLVPLLA